MQFITAHWKVCGLSASHRVAPSHQNIENNLSSHLTANRLKYGVAVYHFNIHLHIKIISELSFLLFLLPLSPYTWGIYCTHITHLPLRKLSLTQRRTGEHHSYVDCLLLIIETERDKERNRIQILVILSEMYVSI